MAFTQEEEVKIIRKAISLTAAIQTEEEAVDALKHAVFDTFPKYEDVFPTKAPKKPVKKHVDTPAKVQPTLPPPPKPDLSFGAYLDLKKELVLAILLGCALVVFPVLSIFFDIEFATFAGVACLIGFFVALSKFRKHYKKRLDELEEEARSNPEYRKAVAEAKSEAAQRQAELNDEARRKQIEADNEYQAQLKHYNEIVLPEYEHAVVLQKEEYKEMQREYSADKEQWKEDREKALAELNSDIAANEAALEDLYQTSKLVSLHYRELWILQWLYDDMRTSDHDIRYATELLDRDRQRIATANAAEKNKEALDEFRKQARQDAQTIKELLSVQIQGLQSLDANASELLRYTESIYDNNNKLLFHQRVNTANIAVQEWRRRKQIG